MKWFYVCVRLTLMMTFCMLLAFARPHSYTPPNGFVPDEKTAIRIAEAVLTPIYGERQIESERPFIATLRGDVWAVTGYLPPGTLGGVAEIRISKKSGKILSVTHGA